jgi:hypothetical protein
MPPPVLSINTANASGDITAALQMIATTKTNLMNRIELKQSLMTRGVCSRVCPRADVVKAVMFRTSAHDTFQAGIVFSGRLAKNPTNHLDRSGMDEPRL